MRPLLAPLVEKWEWVTGDDEQVHDTAQRWRVMSEALTQVGPTTSEPPSPGSRVSREGMAHLAFGAAVDEVVHDLDEIAERAGEVANLLDRAAVAVRRAEQLVRDLIRELIEWAALSLAVECRGSHRHARCVGRRRGGRRRRCQGGHRRRSDRRPPRPPRRGAAEDPAGARRLRVLGQGLGHVPKRLVSTVQGIVIRQAVPLDGKWKPPAIALAGIRVDPERCFEEQKAAPSW